MSNSSNNTPRCAVGLQIARGRPFYLFEYEGMCFAYHYALGECVRVSRAAYECIAKMEDGGGEHCTEDRTLAGEIEKLKNAGFFEPAALSVPDERQFEALLERRYSTAWTKLELALSEVCNLACRYCYCGTCREEVPNQGIMAESVARQAINWLFAVSGKSKDVHMTFFGGEPLMNKPVLKFAVAYSQKLAALHGKKVTY